MTRRTALLALVLAAPAVARATELDATLPPSAVPAFDLGARPTVLLLARVEDPKGKGEKKPQAGPGDLDFDLLGEAKAPENAPDPEAMKLRRQLLTVHQGMGIALYALTLGTTVVGQLNYNDKFGSDANTGKWRTPHAVLAYTTAAVFAVNAGLALAAPAPVKHEWRWDRGSVHRASMLLATLGMAAQIGLGVYTAAREGYVNQQDLAKTHLYIGYGTLAAMTAGVAVLVF